MKNKQKESPPNLYINIRVNYNKSTGIGGPYIHYIAVKVMNVSRISLD